METNLPLGSPPVVGYQYHAYLLSIMGLHPDFPAWLACNYIQLSYRRQACTLDFCNVRKLYPFLTEIYLQKSMIQPYVPCEQFLIDQINKGWYILTFVNEYFIPDRRAYQSDHFVHDIMIHGYDPERRVFQLSGYKADQTYGASEAEYEQLVLSLPHDQGCPDYLQKWADGIHLYKLDTDQHFEFDANTCRTLMEDYLYSRNTAMGWRMYENDTSGVYGLDVYDSVIEHMEETKPDRIDLRMFHILYEHKKVMVDRLGYLQARTKAEALSAMSEQYKQLEIRALSLRNLVLKYVLSGDPKIRSNVTKVLETIRAEERRLLPMIIEHIV